MTNVDRCKAIGPMLGFLVKVEVNMFLLTSIDLCDPSNEFMFLFNVKFFYY